jgi:cell division septation protein DedD
MTHVKTAAVRGDRPDFPMDVFDEADDSYRGFDPRESEAGGRGPLILALAGGVLVVFGAVVWNTYANGLRDPDDPIPLVAAQEGDYREPGEAQTAMVEPDQSRRVYAERTHVPEPEAGVVLPAALSSTEFDPVLKGEPPVDLRPGSGITEANARTDAAGVLGLPEMPPEALSAEGAPVMQEAVADLEAMRGTLNPGEETQTVAALGPVPVEARVEPAPVAAQSGYDFKSNGAFLVQVGAMRSEEAAIEAWETGLARYPAFYRGATRVIQRADLGAKGVYFRVRVGSFESRDKAAEYCDALKAEGGNCIVVER